MIIQPNYSVLYSGSCYLSRNSQSLQHERKDALNDLTSVYLPIDIFFFTNPHMEEEQIQCHLHSFSLPSDHCGFAVIISYSSSTHLHTFFGGISSSEKPALMTYFHFTISHNFPPHSHATLYFMIVIVYHNIYLTCLLPQLDLGFLFLSVQYYCLEKCLEIGKQSIRILSNKMKERK